MSLGSLAQTDSKYHVQSMICVGTITSQTNNRVDPSYSRIGIKLTSFKSTRKHGTLADSLEWINTYANPGEKLDLNFKNYSERWYLSPLYINDYGEVYKLDVSGRGENLRLKIFESKSARGTNVLRKDILIGSLSNPNSVAGSYGYALNCEAIVVSQPQLIMDFTRQ